MKAIMISIKPQYCAKIMNGDKTIEIRKSKALANAIQKLINTNGYADIYVYCSKDKSLIYTDGTDGKGDYVDWQYYESYKGDKNDIGSGKVVFKFRCYKVKEWHNYSWQEITKNACLSDDELRDYSKGVASLYCIHISDLEIFVRPKELSEFRLCCSSQNHFDEYSFKCMRCKAYRVDMSQDEFWCDKRKLELTKAPQNFCYVEV